MYYCHNKILYRLDNEYKTCRRIYTIEGHNFNYFYEYFKINTIRKKGKRSTWISRNRRRKEKSKILFSNPNYCIDYFKYIVSQGENGKFTNEQEAKYCISKGIAAIDAEDIDELKKWTFELSNLLPSKDHPDTHSGLTR